MENLSSAAKKRRNKRKKEKDGSCPASHKLRGGEKVTEMPRQLCSNLRVLQWVPHFPGGREAQVCSMAQRSTGQESARATSCSLGLAAATTGECGASLTSEKAGGA